MTITLSAMVTPKPALKPKGVFVIPVVLSESAKAPTAVSPPPGGAAEQRLIAKGSVLDSSGVTRKRLETKRVIRESGRVGSKRIPERRHCSATVIGAGAVSVLQHSSADSHVSTVRAVTPSDGARRKRIQSN